MRDTSQPLPFLRAARAVFDLSLESMIWSRRSLLMALLVGLPVLLAVAYRSRRTAAETAAASEVL